MDRRENKMSQRTVIGDYEEDQMSGNPVVPRDEAAGPEAAVTEGTEGRQSRDTSPTAGEQQAGVGQADAAGAAEPPSVPAAAGETGAGQAEVPGRADSPADSAAGRVLLDREAFQRRWQDVQVLFVDEPRHALEEADSLVSDAVRELADSLAAERSGIERDWHGAEDASTEDLRLTLLRYRDIFRLLLSV